MAVRRKHIRTLVEQLLSSHRIKSTPIPIETLAHDIGAEVRLRPAEDGLSGFLLRDLKQNRAIIGVNSTHHANRRRFTIAHEMGHFMLHGGQRFYLDGSDRGFQIDRFDLKLRNVEASKGTDVQEKEANLFAAELLMPKSFLDNDLAKQTFDLLDERATNVLSELASRYEVSISALTFRLSYLGYIKH
jgi:Zn-dependent peptidase ImmA (M78 family)